MVSPYFQTGYNRVVGITGRYFPEELPIIITGELSEGLTKIGDNGVPEPAIASSWETPDDGETWIFNIGDKIWHDGATISSFDIRYNFTDVAIDRPDEKTIVFKLEDPYSPFPSVISKPLFKQGLLGTGQWMVDNLTLSQNYAQELVLKDDNKNIIRYKFYANESQAKTAFKLGHVNELLDMYSISPFDEWNSVEIVENVKKDQIVTIFFNTQSEKFKENRFLRQALHYAIDKEALSNNRAISPINPNSWAYNPQVKDYSYDLERAIDMISDVPEEENAKPIVLTTTPPLLDVAEKIRSDWEKLGVKVNINVSSSVDSDYSALLTIFEIPTDPDQYQIWHSTQEVNNISKYGSDRIDSLLEEGRSEMNIENRRRIYIDFQRYLLEDVPAIFLYHPSYYHVIRK